MGIINIYYSRCFRGLNVFAYGFMHSVEYGGTKMTTVSLENSAKLLKEIKR